MKESIMEQETNKQKIETLEVDDIHKDNKVPDRFLPIGSIVTLKEADKSIMIIGYCPVNDNKELFDYCAVLVPEGLLRTDQFLVFNHEAIAKVTFLGYQDEEQKKWVDYIENALKYNDIYKPSETQSYSGGNGIEENVSETLLNSANNVKENNTEKQMINMNN